MEYIDFFINNSVFIIFFLMYPVGSIKGSREFGFFFETPAFFERASKIFNPALDPMTSAPGTKAHSKRNRHRFHQVEILLPIFFKDLHLYIRGGKEIFWKNQFLGGAQFNGKLRHGADSDAGLSCKFQLNVSFLPSCQTRRHDTRLHLKKALLISPTPCKKRKKDQTGCKRPFQNKIPHRIY